ncbi:hypothetical protein BsWGS_03215 [Bradybaena similaris]
MEDKSVLSFGFKKKQDVLQLAPSAVSEDAEPELQQTDFVLSLEGQQVKSTRGLDRAVKKEYVIPLIKQNKWRSGDGLDTDSLELRAVEEILEDTARYNQEWVDRDKEDTNSVIPLLLQNKIPDGFESEERLDVALRPCEPIETDYQQIPIEQFGLAMLRGMGWSKDRGVGKNARVTAPVQAHIRPKGLGLGADRSNSGPDKPSLPPNGVEGAGEVLELKINGHCVVTAGSDKHLYGTVQGLDEDNSRVLVKLALTGRVANIMQSNVRTVSRPEFEKYSKYLNKQKTDEYKAKEMKRAENLENGDSSETLKVQKFKRRRNVHSDNDSVSGSEDKRNKKAERRRDNDSRHKSKHKSRHGRTDKHNSRAVDPAGDSATSAEEKYSGETTSWLRNDLRVRIVDRHLGRGKYYKDKAVVIDVPSQGMCVCKTDGGQVIENVSQLSLETVVPRQEDACVAIVGGSHRGQLGRIMRRDRDQCLALVQLLADRATVLTVPYNDICEYVGDMQECQDY